MKVQSFVKPSKKKMESLAAKRYERMLGKIPYTILRCEQNDKFKSVFFILKKKNYPDWAIYMALLNMSINFRLHRLQNNGQKDPKLLRTAFAAMIEKPETTEESLPDSELTESQIEMAIDLIIMSFLNGEGFESRRVTPNIKALRKFAEEELDFFKYDSPHEKWFSFER